MRVFRHVTKDRKGRLRESRKWYLELKDDQERTIRLPGLTDERSTAEFGRKVEQLVAAKVSRRPPDLELARWIEGLPPTYKVRLARLGLLDPTRLTSAKSLGEHLADFEVSLRAGGVTPKQTRLVAGRAKRVLDACGFQFWSEVNAAEVESCLVRCREEGIVWLVQEASPPSDPPKSEEKEPRTLNAQTSNFYLQAVKQFARWMVRERRALESPVTHLRALNTAIDRRHLRRALTVDEMKKLMAAAHARPVRSGMTGPERAMLYRLAVETGLRASELASLTRSSLELGGEHPTVTIAARAAKSRQESTLPLRRATAQALQDALGDGLPTARVFAMPPIYPSPGCYEAIWRRPA